MSEIERPWLSLPKMPSLTQDEAKWLHANRHTEIAKDINRKRNAYLKDPLDPRARVEWASVIEQWRAGENHPSWRYKND